MAYTIKQMSELTGLPASTLRYYDNEGLLPSLKRNDNNVRIFTDEDFNTLKLINCLKRSGLQLKEIREYMNMARQGDESLEGRRKIFHRRREILKDEMRNLQDILSVIEYKCWYYEKACEDGTESSVKNIHLSEIPEELRRVREILCGNLS